MNRTDDDRRQGGRQGRAGLLENEASIVHHYEASVELVEKHHNRANVERAASCGHTNGVSERQRNFSQLFPSITEIFERDFDARALSLHRFGVRVLQFAPFIFENLVFARASRGNVSIESERLFGLLDAVHFHEEKRRFRHEREKRQEQNGNDER